MAFRGRKGNAGGPTQMIEAAPGGVQFTMSTHGNRFVGGNLHHAAKFPSVLRGKIRGQHAHGFHFIRIHIRWIDWCPMENSEPVAVGSTSVFSSFTWALVVTGATPSTTSTFSGTIE